MAKLGIKVESNNLSIVFSIHKTLNRVSSDKIFYLKEKSNITKRKRRKRQSRNKRINNSKKIDFLA